MGHGQNGVQPGKLRAGEGLHVGEGVVVGKHGAQGHEEDFVDAVEHAAWFAGIGHLREARAEQCEGGGAVSGVGWAASSIPTV